MMVPAVFVQLLLPVSGMVAIYFLLRGHNEPGGGFVAGLIVTTAVILQYLVGGTAWAESRTRIFPQYWLAAGLLCAAGAGMSAWLGARPFLSALAWHGTLPIIGEMHLSTVLLFDLGVFFLVIGAAVLILVALAHQSRRAHRKQEVAEVETPVEVTVEVLGSPAGQGASGHDYPPVEAERQKLPHVLPPKERED
jgi:multicomponent K+:H+ antiporter subunit A